MRAFKPHLCILIWIIFDSKIDIYIQAVEKNSPAEKAGLRQGDIIIAINDIKVSSAAYLKYELYKYNIGDTIKLTYIRNNKEETTNVVLSETK